MARYGIGRYPTAAGGLLEGIRTGMDLGNSVLDRQDRAQDRADARADKSLQQARQATSDARQQKLDAQNDEDRAVKDSEAYGANLGNQLGAIYSKYPDGKGIENDPDAAALAPQVKSWSDNHRALLAKRYQQVVGNTDQAATDWFSKVQTGRIDPQQTDPDEFYRHMVAAGGRDLQDFQRGPNGEPSVVDTGIADFQTGIKTGNNSMVMSGLNTILEPELSKGIGEHYPDGGEIIGKKITSVHLVGSKENPRVVPVLGVTVKYPDGRTVEQPAPITSGRSTGDDDDEVTTIPIKKAFDYIGQTQTLATFLNRPDVQQKLTEGAKTQQGFTKDYLSLMRLAGVDPKKYQPKTTDEKTDLGDRVQIDTVDDQHQVVGSRTLKKGAAPAKEVDDETAAVRGARAKLLEAQTELARARATNVGKGGGAKGTKANVSEATLKAAQTQQENAAADDLGLQWDASRKAWRTKKGNAKPDDATMEQFATRKRAIADNIAKSREAGTRPAAATPAAAPPPPDALIRNPQLGAGVFKLKPGADPNKVSSYERVGD